MKIISCAHILRTLSYLYGILEEKKKRLAEGASSDTTTEDKLQNDDSCAASPELDKSDAMKSDEGTVEGEVKVHISYMEIYQDVGFDLLNPGTRPGSLMLTLPKVTNVFTTRTCKCITMEYMSCVKDTFG